MRTAEGQKPRLDTSLGIMEATRREAADRGKKRKESSASLIRQKKTLPPTRHIAQPQTQSFANFVTKCHRRFLTVAGAREAQKHEPLKLVNAAVKLETKKRELRRAKLEAKRRIKWKAVKGAIFVFVRWSVSAGAASLLRALRDESSLAAPLIFAIYSSGNILPLQAHRPEGCFHTAGDGGQEVLRIYDVTFAFYLNPRVIKPLCLTTSYLLLRGPSDLPPRPP